LSKVFASNLLYLNVISTLKSSLLDPEYNALSGLGLGLGLGLFFSLPSQTLLGAEFGKGAKKIRGPSFRMTFLGKNFHFNAENFL